MPSDFKDGKRLKSGTVLKLHLPQQEVLPPLPAMDHNYCLIAERVQLAENQEFSNDLISSSQLNSIEPILLEHNNSGIYTDLCCK